MTSPYTYAVKLSGGLLLAAVLSSCTLFPSSPGGPDTPRSLAERMERPPAQIHGGGRQIH